MLSTLRRNRPLLVTLIIVLAVLFLMARRFEPKVMAPFASFYEWAEGGRGLRPHGFSGSNVGEELSALG